MNIIQAKQLLLSKFVEHLGGRYAKHTRPHEAWYYSPFRPDEKTPSFKVNELTNRWYDFGHVTARSKNGNGSGGDIIDLWCDFQGRDRRLAVRDALAAIENFFGVLVSSKIKLNERGQESRIEEPRYKITKLHKKIFYTSLKEEINRRCISYELANQYLKQAFIQDNDNPNKKLNGFAFANDKGGHEISIPNPTKETTFKTTIKPKGITTIEGKDETEAMIFEGFWDYLTWLHMNKFTYPPCLVYILNSVSFAGLAAETIRERKSVMSVFLFLDNDNSGFQALHAIAGMLEEDGIKIYDKSQAYQDYKDLNDYWRHGVYSKVMDLSKKVDKDDFSETKNENISL